MKKILRDSETGSIGTEKIRADIVDKLIARGYLKRTCKMISAVDKGI